MYAGRMMWGVRRHDVGDTPSVWIMEGNEAQAEENARSMVRSMTEVCEQTAAYSTGTNTEAVTASTWTRHKANLSARKGHHHEDPLPARPTRLRARRPG